MNKAGRVTLGCVISCMVIGLIVLSVYYIIGSYYATGGIYLITAICLTVFPLISKKNGAFDDKRGGEELDVYKEIKKNSSTSSGVSK